MIRAAALAALLALPAAAQDRKTSAKDFAVDVRRFELPNGLVVLLAPDPNVSSVMVEMTFRAGTLYEPPGRSGMAHLVEHMMAIGPTPDTDYAAMLEQRRARFFNASTTFETMAFQAIVPAEELPLALWVNADRLMTVPPLLDDAMVERNRRIVLEERAVRDVDAPYGLAAERLFSKLFAAPHPLHGAVIGVVDELKQVNAADVRSFATTLLVPANAILTIVGRFDPAEARALVEQQLGAVPAGKRAKAPPLPPLQQSATVSTQEIVSREPAMAVGWRFPLPREQATALRLGSQLLTFMTDGAWGMRVGADLEENEAESMLLVSLVVPWDEPAQAIQGDMEGFLRMLTLSQMPLDLVQTAHVQLDRIALFDVETLWGRAERLARVERLYGKDVSLADDAIAHWRVDPATIRVVAQGFLESPRVVLHARPTRPRPARAGRQW